MEADSAENQYFWKGIAAGFLAGVGVAAFLRYAPFAKTIEGRIEHKVSALQQDPSLPAASMAATLARSAGVVTPAAQSSSAEEPLATSGKPTPSLTYPRSFEMGSAG